MWLSFPEEFPQAWPDPLKVSMKVGPQVLEVVQRVAPWVFRFIEEPVESSNDSEFDDFKDLDEGPDLGLVGPKSFHSSFDDD